jgi:hypothetical protein
MIKLIILSLAVLALPSFASAATYAYVNTSGNVSTYIANDPMTAIQNAPNISLHSGVLLLDSVEDTSVVGDSVSGT